MAETVRGYTVEIKVTNLIDGDNGVSQKVQYAKTFVFSDGTGTNQLGNQFYDASRALNTTSEDLDLGTGGLTDFQGADVILNNIKVLLIENLDSDTGDTFLLKQGATNPATTVLGGTNPTLTIGPGGLCLLVNPVDGYALTDNSADRLAMQATDNSTYTVLIAGDNA